MVERDPNNGTSSSDLVKSVAPAASNRWFTNPQNLDRIVLEDGEWVEIKRRLSIGDRDRISNRLLEIEMQPQQRGQRRNRNSGSNNLTARVRPSTVVLLATSIVDWSFLDEHNNKLPITEEQISLMSTELADLLEEEINARNP